MTKDKALDLALEALEYALPVLDSAWYNQSQAFKAQVAITAIKQARSVPVQEPDAFDCGVYLGKGKDHAIKHHVSYQPAPVQDAFAQLMRDAEKTTPVPESIAKYAAALVAGTHEITSLTIQPKRQWVGLTDEGRKAIYDECQGLDVMKAIIQTEAKLKEKNA